MATKLLTIEEVSERTRIPRATLYQYRTRRKGPPSFRLGTRIVYRESDLEAWLDQQQALTGETASADLK